MGAPEIDFTLAPADSPDASRLLAAFIAEVAALYPGFSAGVGPPASPEDLSPPKGAFVLGLLDGQAVACGGIKRLDAKTAEMKRVYVAPVARSLGVGGRLVLALEDAARELGYSVMRLDTGKSQPHAKQIYLKLGYTEIADYNGNPFASYWFEKALE